MWPCISPALPGCLVGLSLLVTEVEGTSSRGHVESVLVPGGFIDGDVEEGWTLYEFV